MAEKPGRDPRVTVRLPPKQLERLEEEVNRRGMEWEDRGEILIEALGDFFDNRDPAKRKAEMLQAFRDDPEALRELGQMILAETIRQRPTP